MVVGNGQLREEILALHRLNSRWKPAQISQFMLTSENPPSKPRNVLRRLIARTIKKNDQIIRRELKDYVQYVLSLLSIE